MRVIRHWGREQREFTDDLTGRRVWQLTAGEAPSSHFYFSRPTWMSFHHRPFIMSDRGGARNLYTFDDDWSLLQLTDLPPVEGDRYWTSPDGTRFFRAEWFGPAFMGALEDCTGRGIFFRWRFDQPHLMRYDFDTGAADLVLDHGWGCVTVDGRYALAVETRDDVGQQRVSRLFRIELRTGQRDLLLEEPGSFAHVLRTRADPHLVIWLNHHLRKGSKLNPATGALGTWVDFGPAGRRYGHHSFLPGSTLILVLHRDPPGGPEWTIQDAEGHVVDELGAMTAHHISHASTSHSHRYVVGDSPRPAAGRNHLYLMDRVARAVAPLCRCDSSWTSRDEAGRPVASEYLHPRPVFSPDDRYVLFASDFGSSVSQVYLVEI